MPRTLNCATDKNDSLQFIATCHRMSALAMGQGMHVCVGGGMGACLAIINCRIGAKTNYNCEMPVTVTVSGAA